MSEFLNHSSVSGSDGGSKTNSKIVFRMKTMISSEDLSKTSNFEGNLKIDEFIPNELESGAANRL